MPSCLSTLWEFLYESRFSTFWTAFGALFTAIGALAVIFAARKIDFNAWVKAQEIYTHPDFTAARRVVLLRYRQDRATPWSQPDRDQALHVYRKMDEFARIIPFLRRRLVLKIWYDPIGKCWDVLESIVQQERRDCEWPEKWSAFEDLGIKARKRLRSRA